MEKIAFKNVSKAYNGSRVVKNLSFQIREGETFVLIGTSGCGKTTTLKMINRLIEPTEGEIRIDGRSIFDYNPIHLRRKIGYAIQSVGLFPHISVGKNIGILLELMRWPQGKIINRVKTLLEMVGLSYDIYKDRFPAELSGGQKQRVGVARALAADPPIIIMDEPFGALDPITREQLQNEFLALIQNLKKTIVFVTHDIYEAIRLADRIAIMDKGEIIQIGKPIEIVDKPANGFVLNFIGKNYFQISMLLTQIKEVMSDKKCNDEINLSSCLEANATIVDALYFFRQHNVDVVLVKDLNGNLIGSVSKGAIQERFFRNI